MNNYKFNRELERLSGFITIEMKAKTGLDYSSPKIMQVHPRVDIDPMIKRLEDEWIQKQHLAKMWTLEHSAPKYN